MNTGSGIRTAAVWGICAIVSEIALFITIDSASGAGFGFSFQFIWWELVIALCAIAFAAHVRGYVKLGVKLHSRLLEYSSLGLAFTSTLLGAGLLLASASTYLFGGSETYLSQILLVACVGLFSIAGVLFVISILKPRRQIGVRAALSLGLVLFPLFILKGWPMALCLIPSTIFLF
jgi:hypothetical protein